MKQVYIKTRDQWRKWLSQNHGSNSGIWLVFYKKHTGKPSPEYEDAIQEALCFGWVDSIIKRIDDDRYARKFTPRKPGSRWSELNKKRIGKLTKQGLMRKSGLAVVAEAKKTGLWEKTDRPKIPTEVPEELKKALAKNKEAKKFFDQLAPTYRRHFIGWIFMAKRKETKDRRVAESIKLLEKGKKLGLK